MYVTTSAVLSILRLDLLLVVIPSIVYVMPGTLRWLRWLRTLMRGVNRSLCWRLEHYRAWGRPTIRRFLAGELCNARPWIRLATLRVCCTLFGISRGAQGSSGGIGLVQLRLRMLPLVMLRSLRGRVCLVDSFPVGLTLTGLVSAAVNGTGGHTKCRSRMDKVSKTDAHYRNGTDIHRCGNCAYYKPVSSTCTRVEGPIRSNGLSDLWAPKRAVA